FEKALAINPDQADALGQVAGLYIEKGDEEQALKRCEAQLKLASRPAPIYQIIGQIHQVKKDFKKAEEGYKKAIETDANLLSAYMALGSLYIQNKSFDQAIKQYEGVKKVNPKTIAPYVLIGIIYDQLQEYDKANIEYEGALKIDPKLAPAANNLAWNYSEHGGNIDVALSLAETARERLPEDPSVADTLGWIYYKKNVYLKAIGLLKETAEKLETNPVIRYHLGMAYYKNGNKDQAKKELEASLKLNENYPGAEEARKTLRELKE
ncbi:MAG TPA: tetratricopeptide repeat protein, partial [Candidatus Brocadiales bacterium]|nr:tetratricopeptide repeat protein [Candidatus Brocadiales bacterium]